MKKKKQKSVDEKVKEVRQLILAIRNDPKEMKKLNEWLEEMLK